MQGLDSTTTTNRLAMLRLGSTTTTIDDSDGTVIFSDPCSCCGSMKRLRSSSSSSSSPLQEDSSPPPPRNKKILIESPSFSSINTVSVSPPPSNIQPTANPFLVHSIPNSSFTAPTSPSLQSLPFNSVVSCFNSKSSSVPFIRRCNSVPLTQTSQNTSEINNNNNVNSLPSSTTSPQPVSFSNPKSPENFGSPPSKPVAAYLDRMNSFTGSCGTQKSAAEESPVRTTSLPPRPTLYRSFSDVNPCVTPALISNSDEMTTLTASGQSGQIHGSGSPAISDGDNPSSRRWKRMKKSLMEMNKWLNHIIQEQSKEDDAAVDDDDDDEGEEKKIDNDQVQQIHDQETVAEEENVTAERDGDAMKVRYVCSCGKHYQIAMSI